MTFGEHIVALLSADAGVTALVGTKIFPQVAPQGAQPPYVVYTVLDRQEINSLEGSTAGLDNARAQVDCYAKPYLVAQELADRVAAVLKAHTTPGFSSMQLSRQDAYDDEAMLHRVISDFSQWKGD